MRSTFFLSVLTVLVISCNKGEDDYIYIDGSGLAGKWVALERYSSTGVDGSWYPLTPEDWFTIEFKADSSFTYSPAFPQKDSLFSKYSLAGRRIKVSSVVNSKTGEWFYNFNDSGRLVLSIFPCFEGCPYRLRRIQ